MAITVKRARNPIDTSRSMDPQTTVRWKIRSDGPDITRDQAYVALLNAIPAVEDFLLINKIDLTGTNSGKIWNATVLYKVDPMPSTNFVKRFKGSTRGGSARINRSIQTRQAEARTGTDVIQFGGAIEVDDKGQVKGTTVPAPRLEFSLELTIDASLFSFAYMKTLYQLTPSVNDRVFGPFATYECLFLGAEWNYTTQGSDGAEMVVLTYYFEAGANESITVAGFANPIQKMAHDHLWVIWENHTDGGTGLVFRRPRQINVEEVARPQNLSALGLGL